MFLCYLLIWLPSRQGVRTPQQCTILHFYTCRYTAHSTEAISMMRTVLYFLTSYALYYILFVLDYIIVDVHARNLNQVGLRMWRHGLMIGLQDGTGTVLACHDLSCEMLHPFGLKQGDHELFSVFYHSYALRCFRLVFCFFSPAFHKMECSIRCI